MNSTFSKDLMISLSFELSITDILDIVISLFLVWVILDIIGIGTPEKIEGLFSIPETPIIGNLLEIWNHPSKVFMHWGAVYRKDMFQIRIGCKRMIVVNSFDDIKQLWVHHAVANNSRPVSFTFHDIVSASQGFTVGSTPAGETYQRKKKTISMELNRRNVDLLSSILDEETKYTMKKIVCQNIELNCLPSENIYNYINTRFSDIDLLKYGQYFALRSAISIAYGWQMDCFNSDSELANEIIEVESEIIKLRSPITNLQDYFPFLRYKPLSLLSNASKANFWRIRRDKYMDYLLENLQQRIQMKNLSACQSLIGRCLLQNTSELSFAEIQSLCLTLVSAGLDNTSFNFNHLMGHLSQPNYGYLIQETAFKNLMNCYDDNAIKAWKLSAYEMNCDYIMALVEECFRFFTVLPLALPRTTTKKVRYKNINIPEDTILFMNAYAANHDPTRFPEPFEFIPERWLDKNTGKMLSSKQISHVAFGAGSRKCSGQHLAVKGLYTLTARMILLFKIRRPIDSSMLMVLDPFKNDSCPNATSFEPKPFKVRLKQRHHRDSNALYNILTKRN